MTTLCNVAHPDVLIFFYLFIYLFIDEEAGNGLAVGCTAFKRHFVDYSGAFHYEYCHFLFLKVILKVSGLIWSSVTVLMSNTPPLL